MKVRNDWGCPSTNGSPISPSMRSVNSEERVQAGPCSEEDGIAMLLLLYRDYEVR